MRILTFGAVAEIIGQSSFTMDDHFSSTKELIQQLEADFPRLKTVSFVLAVNRQVVNRPAPLTADATVALLPPFSGG